MRSSLYLIPLFGLLLCGCADEVPDPNPALCDTNSECPDSQICQQGVCGVVETEPRLLSFVLDPPSDSPFPSQRVKEDEFSINEPLQILLNSGVRVEGTIAFANQPAIGPSGSLTFENSASNAKVQTRVEQPEGYSVTVPAGTYAVTFVPDDPQTPSKVWPELTFERNTDPKLSIPATYTVVSGSLSRVDSNSGDTELLTGVTVFAVSRETGGISTTATTEDGFFNISVLPNTGEYDLRIVPTESRPFVPNTVFEKSFVTEENTWRPTEPEGGDLLALSLGSYAIPTSTQTFKLVSTDDLVSDWTGARATLRVEAGRGVMDIVADVAMDGSFDVPNFDQEVTLKIVTPAESPAAGTQLTGSVEGWASEIEIETKTRYSATLQTWDNHPVIDATIEAVPVGGSAEDVIKTITDENGEIVLWLAEFDYIVTVIPQDAALPRATLSVSGTASSQKSARIVIPEPTVVWGSVFAASENSEKLVAVQDVVVRAIESLGGVERRIGEGSTNDNGEFKLVVPSR